MRSLFASIAKDMVRKVFGDHRLPLLPGQLYRVRYTIASSNRGVVLRGSTVEFLGLQDPKGKLQVEVIGLPDYQWNESSKLPYGPGFVVFIEPDALEYISE